LRPGGEGKNVKNGFDILAGVWYNGIKGCDVMLKIYLDNCCYNRPFDDLTQIKINLEAKAIESILSMHENEKLEIYTSEVVNFEISSISDTSKKQQVEDLHDMLPLKNIESNDLIKNRAIELRKSNIKDMDSLHIAFAESANVDYFITTDKILINVSNRVKLKTKIINPIKFVMEVE